MLLVKMTSLPQVTTHVSTILIGFTTDKQILRRADNTLNTLIINCVNSRAEGNTSTANVS